MTDATRQVLEGLVREHRVLLFMKGSRHFPMCGFSAKTVEVLTATGTDFQTVNVLADPAIRSGIKEFGNWPTIPQLYVDGQLVGGCDIVTELAESGELARLLEPPGAADQRG